MSSTAYVAVLATSKTLRRLVLSSGAILLVSGLACIASLPLDLAGRLVLVVVWVYVTGREIRVHRRAYMTFRYMSIDPHGNVSLYGHGGGATAANISAGSVLLQKLGWLRLRTLDGRCFGELMAGNCRKNKDWRRLQVIWRHL